MNILTNAVLLKLREEYSVLSENPKWIISENLFEKFDYKIIPKDVINQHNTGYCWLISYLHCIDVWYNKFFSFSILNEVSIGYMIFYDKLEKSNWFLNRFIERIEMDISDEDIQYLLHHAAGDQGQWTMADNLVKKYGLIDTSAMKETISVRDTRSVNFCIKTILQVAAYSLRKIWEVNKDKQLLKIKAQESLKKIYEILVRSFGMPPNDAQRKIDFPSSKYTNIICGKTQGMEHFKLKIELDGNIEEYGSNSFLRVDENTYKDSILQKVKNEGFCWIACDSDKFLCKSEGVLDDNNFVFPPWFDRKCYDSMNRFDLANYGISNMSHAIMLCQCCVVDNELWWLAKNTLGKNHGKNGFIYISDHWLNKFSFQAVVNKNYLCDYKSKLISCIKPWQLSRLI